MSYRAAAGHDEGSSASSQSSIDDDDRCSDWESDIDTGKTVNSLFGAEVFSSVKEALEHDKKIHGFDLEEAEKKLDLDMYGRIRLVNLIRRDKLNPAQVRALEANGEWVKDDQLLIPVIVDDPLLQLDFDEEWSDDEMVAGPSKTNLSGQSTDGDRVSQLQRQLEVTRKELVTAQSLLQESFQEKDEEIYMNGVGKGKGKAVSKAERDDDTHYFDSYAENDIHEVMLKDRTRTVSYARFILSNPSLFKDAIVMDVGCGTGILSMFAARAGAKHVYAIEASGLASKARENIKSNGLGGTITVIQGKVEDIELPVEKVDVIISEWMGYMLLYESMLDSVLFARDRYLRQGGLMAPSQTRLVISGITGEEIWKERIEFWQSVYGFNMSGMSDVYFKDGLVEVVNPKEVMTDEAIVRDIDTHIATPKSLDFHSSFTLNIKSSGTIHAFLTWFDTFFSPSSQSHIPETQAVDLSLVCDKISNEVKAVDPGTISFTTGPFGKETHWRQVAFLLKEPILVSSSNKIHGKFFCRKSPANSRELDVEIHFSIIEAGSEMPRTEDVEYKVQIYRVR